MGTIAKEKNLFIITLDNGKTCSFDFSDNTYHGISGKVVTTFNSEAKKILRHNKNDDFLAMYFSNLGLTYPRYRGLNEWSTNMVETIYSLFGDLYCTNTLCSIAEFCYQQLYTLDKKGIKILKDALASLNNQRWIGTWDIERAIKEQSYKDIPDNVKFLIMEIKPSYTAIIKEDVKKISYRMEHENWNCLYGKDSNYYQLARFIERYIELCKILHYDRDYKDLFRSICQMEKEKDLMADKLCADYQTEAPLYFEDDDLTVLIPTTADEFHKEADYQSNCVFRLYYPKVKNMETHVVFIRKKSDINTPYITCEVSNDGKIIQYLTRFNSYPTDKEALDFREKYTNFLSENF